MYSSSPDGERRGSLAHGPLQIYFNHPKLQLWKRDPDGNSFFRINETFGTETPSMNKLRE